MDMINERVEHIVFGDGVVTELNENKILVQFQDNIGTKKFVYPDVFEKFLKAADPIAQNNVMEEWHKKQEQVELELKRLEKEREDVEIEEKKTKLSLTNKKSKGKPMKKRNNS